MPHARKMLVLLAVTTLLACLSISASAELTREESHSFALAADGRVSLENINGDVAIEGWDRNEVSIEAVVRARTERALEEVEIDIDAGDSGISISTEYPHREHGGRHDAASVDYTLFVPRGAQLDDIELVNGSLTLAEIAGGVSAEVVNGKVEARGLSGSAELSTVNGSLEAGFYELSSGQSIDLESVNGSVTLSLANAVDAEIEASTVHGSINNDFGLEVDSEGFVGKSLSGTVGAGGGRISLETVNGSIKILQQ